MSRLALCVLALVATACATSTFTVNVGQDGPANQLRDEYDGITTFPGYSAASFFTGSLPNAQTGWTAITINVGDTINFVFGSQDAHTVTYTGATSIATLEPLADNTGLLSTYALPVPRSLAASQTAWNGGVTVNSVTDYFSSGICPGGPMTPWCGALGSSFPVTFNTNGTFIINCLPHSPFMSVVVTVNPAGTAYTLNSAAQAQALAGSIAGWNGANAAAYATAQIDAKTANPVSSAIAGGGRMWQACAGCGDSAAGGAYVRFTPWLLSINVGDSVTWSVGPLAPHTVSFSGVGNDDSLFPPDIQVKNGAIYSNEAVWFTPSVGAGAPCQVTGGGSTVSCVHDPNAGLINSGLLAADPSLHGFSSFVMKFPVAGTWHYRCLLHDGIGMDGIVVVNEAPNSFKVAVGLDSLPDSYTAATGSFPTSVSAAFWAGATPGAITINAGDWIEFDWTSIDLHNVVFTGVSMVGLFDPQTLIVSEYINPPMPTPVAPWKHVFDGQTWFSSGGCMKGSCPPFMVQFQLAGTYTLYCQIHGGMTLTVTVNQPGTAYPVAPAAQAAALAQGAANFQSAVNMALVNSGVVGATQSPSWTLNADGITRTWTVTSGLADDAATNAAHLRYTPWTLAIAQGDTVQWINGAVAPHTVTFAGASDANYPGFIVPKNISIGQFMLNPQAVVSTADFNPGSGLCKWDTTNTIIQCTHVPDQFINSGMMWGVNNPASHSIPHNPAAFQIKFDKNTPVGTYYYHCLFHDDLGMIGQIQVFATEVSAASSVAPVFTALMAVVALALMKLF